MSRVCELFTIIIPAREYCKQTDRVVKGIRRLYPEVKIILVLDKLAEVKLDALVLECSGTISKKRNMAAKIAETQFISFIDSDALCLESWLENSLLQFRKDKNIGMVAGPNIPFEGESFQQRLSYQSNKSFLISGRNSFEKSGGFSGNVNRAPSCNMHIRAELFKQLGGMNELLETAEDLEFCYRLINSGKKIFFDDTVRVFHRNRKLKGFLLQRFTWGYTLFCYARLVSARDSWVLFIPFCSILVGLFLLLLGSVNIIYGYILISLILLLLTIVIIEALRIEKKYPDRLFLILFIFFGCLIPGVGTLISLFNINLKIKKIYNNRD